jgi:hypothetical protein
VFDLLLCDGDGRFGGGVGWGGAGDGRTAGCFGMEVRRMPGGGTEVITVAEPLLFLCLGSRSIVVPAGRRRVQRRRLGQLVPLARGDEHPLRRFQRERPQERRLLMFGDAISLVSMAHRLQREKQAVEEHLVGVDHRCNLLRK